MKTYLFLVFTKFRGQNQLLIPKRPFCFWASLTSGGKIIAKPLPPQKKKIFACPSNKFRFGYVPRSLDWSTEPIDRIGMRPFDTDVTMASTPGSWSSGCSSLRCLETLKCRRQRKAGSTSLFVAERSLLVVE